MSRLPQTRFLSTPPKDHALRITSLAVDPDALFGPGNYATYEFQELVVAAGLAAYGHTRTGYSIPERMVPVWRAYKAWVQERLAAKLPRPTDAEVSAFVTHHKERHHA